MNDTKEGLIRPLLCLIRYIRRKRYNYEKVLL